MNERVKRAFIIHGAYGTPQENWIPWLKENLEIDGLEVILPTFPTPRDQSLANWLRVFDDFKERVDE